MGATKRILEDCLDYIEVMDEMKSDTLLPAARAYYADRRAELTTTISSYMQAAKQTELKVTYEGIDRTFKLTVDNETIRDNTDDEVKATVRTYTLICE